MILIDKLSYASQIRYKSPFLKCGFGMGTLCVCVAARSFIVSLFIMAVMGYLTVRFSKVSFCRYLKMMAVPLSFLILGTIAIAVDFPKEPMGFFDLAIGERYVSVSVSSLTYSLRLILTALSSVSCLYFISLTTPMLDIIQVMKKIRLPWMIIEITILMYRFIFILSDMAAAIMLSQDCRLGNISFRKKIDSMGQMLSVLLIRALNKANKLYDAMESRCYDGKIQVLWDNEKAEKKDICMVIVFFAVLFVLTAISKIYGGI